MITPGTATSRCLSARSATRPSERNPNRTGGKRTHRSRRNAVTSTNKCRHNVSFQITPPDDQGMQEKRCGQCLVLLELIVVMDDV